MNNHKTGRRILQFSLYILYFLIGLGIGFGVATALTRTRPGSLRTIPFLICLVVTFGLQRWIHWLGHWCLGRFSGLQLIAYSTLHSARVKEGSRFQLRRAPAEMLLSSCLMSPKEGESLSYTAYWLGGPLFNLLAALTSLLILELSAWSLGSVLGCFFFSLFLTGLWQFLFSGLPVMHGKLPNDGLKTITFLRHPAAKEAFEKNLKILSFLSNGRRPLSQLPKDLLTSEEDWVSNPFQTALLLRQYELQFLLGNQASAYTILIHLYQNLKQLPEEWQTRVWQECIFCLAYRRLDPDLASRLLTELRRQQYEEAATAESLRCLFAWAYYVQGNNEMAAEYEAAAKKAIAQIAFRPMAEAWKQVFSYFHQFIS